MSAHRRSVASFAEDRNGTVAIIFGFTIFLMIFAVGFAIDIARAYHASSKGAAALDAAALAAAKVMREQPGRTDAELTKVAQDYFTANIEKAGIGLTTFQPVQLTIDRNAGSIKADVPATIGTFFARIAGPTFETINIQKTALAVYNLKDIELGMALDITGSMCAPCTKIADLKAAAADLVDIMMPDGGTPGRTVRIGLAPYAASVRLPNAMAAAVTNGASTDGCVVERSGSAAYDDDAPGPGRFLGARTASSPPNSHYSCNSAGAMVQPLTEQTMKATLKNRIASLPNGGWTAGQIGTAWAWYLISPEWNGIWGLSKPLAPYKDGKTIKAILLMTDGEFNTSYANGAQNATSENQALQLCQKMKSSAHDVIVYAVAFQAPLAAKQLLQSCASSTSSPYFFDAADGQALRQAFKDIAISLNNLRLSQ